jgi:hypothetical protein
MVAALKSNFRQRTLQMGAQQGQAEDLTATPCIGGNLFPQRPYSFRQMMKSLSQAEEAAEKDY